MTDGRLGPHDDRNGPLLPSVVIPAPPSMRRGLSFNALDVNPSLGISTRLRSEEGRSIYSMGDDDRAPRKSPRTPPPSVAHHPTEMADESTTAMMVADYDDDYDEDAIERYVRFYKANNGRVDGPPADDDAIDAGGGDDDADDDREKKIPPTPKEMEEDSGGRRKKKKKRSKTRDASPLSLETRRTIQLCCRDNDLPRALRTYRHALSNTVRLEAQAFYQLLNLCEGTFAERIGVHVGTPRGHPANAAPGKCDRTEDAVVGKDRGGGGGNDDDHDDHDDHDDERPPRGRGTTTNIPIVSLERRLYHANHIHGLLARLNVPLIEQAYTALIRLSSRAGDLERALGYLSEAERTQQCRVKLRTYSCLLRAYCGISSSGTCDDGSAGGEDGAIVGAERAASVPTKRGLIEALRLWRRMYDNSGGVSDGRPHRANANVGEGRNDGNKDDGRALFGEGISPKIALTECEYSAIIHAATELGDAPVMERLLGDVADAVLVPGSNTTRVILRWFRSNSSIARDADNESALAHVALPPREGPCFGPATNDRGWVIYPNSTVDATTGALSLGPSECAIEREIHGDECAGYRYRLGPVELSAAAWRDMRDMNESIVLEGQVEGNVSQYQGGGKGKKRARGVGDGNGGNGQTAKTRHGNNGGPNGLRWRSSAWKQFENFIRDHPRYDVVIDGANVGYYEQNFANAPRHIDYRQIDWLLRHVLGERPPSSGNDDDRRGEDRRAILFLHERHFSHKLAPDWANRLIRSWDGNDPPYDRLTVYRTPVGMNDDWFWMHAALIDGGNAGVPPVLVVTNDEMRDHHFQMLARCSFLRWKERHQVHFDFGPWNKDLGRRDVYLQYPNNYSRRIQHVECDGPEGADAFVIPLPKKGDERRFADGIHVAEEGVPDQEMYVVIQRRSPPSRKSG
jgi:ribonuclease P protein 3